MANTLMSAGEMPLILEACPSVDTRNPATCYDTIKVDVDGDGIMDVKFYWWIWKYAQLYIHCIGCQVRAVERYEGDTIISSPNPATNWGWESHPSPYGNPSIGDFWEKLGFHKTIDGEDYYGWLHIYRIDTLVPSPNNPGYMVTHYKFCVDKVAFCTIPDYPLVWGQTEFLGLEENEDKASGKLHPNPTKGIVYIEGEKVTEVQVFNAFGQLVKAVQNSNEISLEGLPQGVYLLRIATEDGKVFSNKVVKE